MFNLSYTCDKYLIKYFNVIINFRNDAQIDNSSSDYESQSSSPEHLQQNRLNVYTHSESGFVVETSSPCSVSPSGHLVRPHHQTSWSYDGYVPSESHSNSSSNFKSNSLWHTGRSTQSNNPWTTSSSSSESLLKLPMSHDPTMLLLRKKRGSNKKLIYCNFNRFCIILQVASLDYDIDLVDLCKN